MARSAVGSGANRWSWSGPVNCSLVALGWGAARQRDQAGLLRPVEPTAAGGYARDLYFINSRHDPYGCDDRQGRAMFERLGGTQIVRDDGHFGDHDQPYQTFKLVDKLID